MSRTTYNRRSLFSKGNSKNYTEPKTKVATVKESWENESFPASATRTTTTCAVENSPTLVHLREHSAHVERPTSKVSGYIHAAQQELEKMHHKAKSNVAGMSGVGGGVSMWPAMDDMRLSRDDFKWLFAVCIALVSITFAIFCVCHGTHVSILKQYASKLQKFHSSHYDLESVSDQILFNQNLLTWHRDFLDLQKSIQRDLNVVWQEASKFDIVFFILYTLGIIVLLYFLLENAFSKNRLTPRRIKVWVALLCCVTTWTLLSFYLLLCAQAIETATQKTVHGLSEHLADLVQSPLDLTTFHSVLLYWRTRCLPPTSQGVLSIMGILQVQDVSYYLQYYSLPILTALCTPFIKIIFSLRAVYGQ